MYLPDTNIFIRALHDIEPEASLLKKIIEQNEVAVSVIVIAEFFSKADLLRKEKNAFDKLILTHKIIPISEDEARIAGDYRRQFSRKTKKAFLQDCFLAAQAKLNNFILVTNNRSDFPMNDIEIISPSAITSSTKH